MEYVSSRCDPLRACGMARLHLQEHESAIENPWDFQLHEPSWLKSKFSKVRKARLGFVQPASSKIQSICSYLCFRQDQLIFLAACKQTMRVENAGTPTLMQPLYQPLAP